jgi:hypothetical protein
MKILKFILVLIVSLVLLVLVAALFVKKEYSVERSVVINKPKQEVFDYVKLLKNQENYNKWVKADPNISRDYKGTDGTVGFIVAWEGNSKVGKGEQEITKITEGERLDCALRFKKPMESNADTYMATETTGNNQTKLTWSFRGKNKYPMNFMNLFMGGMLGNDMETSLADLKQILEK